MVCLLLLLPSSKPVRDVHSLALAGTLPLMSPHAEGEDILALQTVLYPLTSAVAEGVAYFCAVRAMVSSQVYCNKARRSHSDITLN